ncbi:MAG: hypothetical protein QOE39_3018, partial [Bradyrhizobium sp.]|nr:hypothetical protein [Bradyrhizobium sp.]
MNYLAVNQVKISTVQSISTRRIEIAN